MLPFRDLTIRKKLTLFLMGTITFAVLLVGFGLYALLVNQYQHLYQADLDGLAMVLGANCNKSIVHQNVDEAQTILASLKVRSSIILAFLYSKDGKLFAAYRGNSETSITPTDFLNISRLNKWSRSSGILSVTREIKQDNESIGILVLIDDMRSINHFRVMAMLTLIVIIIIVLSSSSVVAAQFRELISKPISELAALSHRVSETRDYSLRAVKYGSDEVGELVDEFNNMLQRISERTHELQESEQLFRNVINQAADAIFLHDTSGRLVDVNERACCSLGYTREELLTLNIADIAPRSGSDESMKRYWNLPCSEPAITLEAEHQCKNGFTFPVEVKMGTMDLGDRHLVISVARDITERLNVEEEKRKLETQLQQAQKMESIGTLAGGIAHDFNNILSPIFGYIELTMAELPEDHKFRPYLSEVYQAAERAKELVRQILTFSREEVEQRSPVEIGVIIKEALKLLRASIPTSIEIKSDIRECGMVLANPTQLHQILMNLCTNGYQAMRNKGGILGVSLKSVLIDSSDAIKNVVLKPGRYLCLEVSDTGEGINQENLPKIFDPYFTTKGKGEGTGLGLSVVHGIVKSHGGHITAYSEQNKGSVFKVYLPEIEQEAKICETVMDKEIPRGTERLMIVDDEDTIMELEKKYLETLGYRVWGFTDPSLAWKAFDSSPRDFDLVLTDMTMPKLTGDLLSLKILEKRPNIPIILCTGFSEIINEEKARAIGVKQFITKPIIFRELSVTVRKILDAAYGKSSIHP